MATLTSDQQKRLLAAEMAFKTVKAGASIYEFIHAADEWLKFIDAGKFSIDKFETSSTAVEDLKKLARGEH